MSDRSFAASVSAGTASLAAGAQPAQGVGRSVRRIGSPRLLS